MLRTFFDLIASGLFVATVLTLIGGLLNSLLGWNLSLSIGGSSNELPHDLISTLLFSSFLGFLGGLSWALGNAEKVVAFVRQKPALVAGLAVALMASLYGAYYTLSGGALGAAVERGDAQAVVQTLEGKSYSQKELDGHLYQSLRKGNLEVARALVAGGANPNRISQDHDSPMLVEAVVWFPQASVLALMELGADPKREDSLGRNPVHTMLLYRLEHVPEEKEEGLVTLLEAMLARGVDLAKASNNGDTPDSLARQHKFSKVSDWLASHTVSKPEP